MDAVISAPCSLAYVLIYDVPITLSHHSRIATPFANGGTVLEEDPRYRQHEYGQKAEKTGGPADA